MADSTIGILKRALALVEGRRPDAYGQMAGKLSGLSLLVDAGDVLHLRSDGARLVESAPKKADIRVETSRSAIRQILSGELLLDLAVRTEAVRVYSRFEHLGQVLTAFEYFVGALLRLEEAQALRSEIDDE